MEIAMTCRQIAYGLRLAEDVRRIETAAPGAPVAVRSKANHVICLLQRRQFAGFWFPT